MVRVGTLTMIGDEKQKTYQVKLPNDQTTTKDNKSFVKRAPIPPENSSSKEMNPNDSSGWILKAPLPSAMEEG